MKDTWVKPLQHMSKYILIFTMLIISVLTSNVIGFLIYFTSYQIASVIRVIVYNILGQTTKGQITTDQSYYDFLDIATFITTNSIPNSNLLPLYAIAFTIAFVLYNTWNYPMTPQQFGITCILGTYLVFQLLSVFMVIGTSPFTIGPYFEIISGYAFGTLACYGIDKVYPSALFFPNLQPRRKRLICRPKIKP